MKLFGHEFGKKAPEATAPAPEQPVEVPAPVAEQVAVDTAPEAIATEPTAVVETAPEVAPAEAQDVGSVAVDAFAAQISNEVTSTGNPDTQVATTTEPAPTEADIPNVVGMASSKIMDQLHIPTEAPASPAPPEQNQQ